jgi:hypothetical protein
LEAAPTTAVPMATPTAMPTPTTAAPVATATLVVERLREKESEPARVMEFIPAKQANRQETKERNRNLPPLAHTLELNMISDRAQAPRLVPGDTVRVRTICVDKFVIFATPRAREGASFGEPAWRWHPHCASMQVQTAILRTACVCGLRPTT